MNANTEMLVLETLKTICRNESEVVETHKEAFEWAGLERRFDDAIASLDGEHQCYQCKGTGLMCLGDYGKDICDVCEGSGLEEPPVPEQGPLEQALQDAVEGGVGVVRVDPRELLPEQSEGGDQPTIYPHPECMAPDGADPCSGYKAVLAELTRARNLITGYLVGDLPIQSLRAYIDEVE